MQKHIDGHANQAVNTFTELLKRRRSLNGSSPTQATLSADSSFARTESDVVPEFMATTQYKAFDLPNCKLNHVLLPDGSKKIVQTAPDFSSRVLLKRSDGSMEEKVCDHYGRPVFVKEVGANSEWTSSEWKYFDSENKVSPFISTKRVTTSDGTIREISYDSKGTIIGQLERTDGSRMGR